MLKKITRKLLREDLDVVNLEHQDVILSTINRLFPSFPEKYVDLASSLNGIQGNELRRQFDWNSSSSAMNSMETTSVSCRSMATVQTDRSKVSIRSLREEDEYLDRKLILTLSREQLVEKINPEDIERKFAQFDFAVNLEKINDSDKPGTYIVTFESEDCKTQAYQLGQEMGYKLVKKRAPRPSPENPV